MWLGAARAARDAIDALLLSAYLLPIRHISPRRRLHLLYPKGRARDAKPEIPDPWRALSHREIRAAFDAATAAAVFVMLALSE
jgi:hypothetical protein